MKRLLTLLLLLSGLTWGQVQTTVTGVVQDPGGNLATSGTVIFTLQPQNQGIVYYVAGVGVISPQTVTCGIDGSGNLKNLALSGNCLVWGVDLITPANLTYQASFYPNGTFSNAVSQLCVKGNTFDLSNPIFCPVIKPTPQFATVITSPVQNNLIPSANGVFSVGSSAMKYANGFFNTLNVGTCVGCAAPLGYQVIQNAAVGILQRTKLNFLGSLSCVDNPGNTSSDCSIADASASVSGQVNTGAQTFTGNKTFNNNVTVNGNTALQAVTATSVNSSGPVSGTTGTFTSVTSSGNIAGPVTATTLSASGNATLTAGQNQINFYNTSNRIYVDGVKYSLTQAGIQQALTDACAITAGGANHNGTTVYLPPMIVSGATGLTMTCALRLVGAGQNQTAYIATTGPALTLAPASNTTPNDQWVISDLRLDSNTINTDVIDVTLTTNPINKLTIERDELNPDQGGSGWAINVTCTLVNCGFDWRVRDNTLVGGVNIGADASTHGVCDGVQITGNSAVQDANNTNPLFQLAGCQGAGNWFIANNRSTGFAGGMVVIKQGTNFLLDNNQFEQSVGTGTPSGCMVELVSSFGSVFNTTLRHNNLNDTTAAHVACLNGATATKMDNNIITVPNSDTAITATTGTIEAGKNIWTLGTNAVTGLVPSCSSTGLGTGTCTVSSGDGFDGVVILSPAGTPSASGTVTLTFPIAFPNNAACVANLENASGAWNARGTTIGNGITTTQCKWNWDNNAVALTASSTYDINYHAGMQK